MRSGAVWRSRIQKAYENRSAFVKIDKIGLVRSGFDGSLKINQLNLKILRKFKIKNPKKTTLHFKNLVKTEFTNT
jgi:hypothetical protein